MGHRVLPRGTKDGKKSLFISESSRCTLHDMKPHKKSCFSPIIDRIEEIIRATNSKGGEVEALHLFLIETGAFAGASKDESRALLQAVSKWRKSRPAPSKREREVQKEVEKLASGSAAAPVAAIE
jgi:hypothetical protein